MKLAVAHARYLRGGVVVALALLASCQGRHGLTADPASDDGAANRCADTFAQSKDENDPCAVDADCHSGFLVCVRNSVDACRDPTADAGPVTDDCPGASLVSLPLCPATAKVAVSLCAVRYQIPCTVATDCGPAGFTCDGGQCREQAGQPCTTADTCPKEWECSAPCACTASAPKSCNPPFAKFGCPACIPVPGP